MLSARVNARTYKFLETGANRLKRTCFAVRLARSPNHFMILSAEENICPRECRVTCAKYLQRHNKIIRTITRRHISKTRGSAEHSKTLTLQLEYSMIIFLETLVLHLNLSLRYLTTLRGSGLWHLAA